jgi:hypothetical protein
VISPVAGRLERAADGASEVGVAHEEALLVMVAVHKPAGDVVGGGAADLTAGGVADVEASKTLPFLSRDAGLSENGSQEILPAVVPMGVRNPWVEMLPGHELVIPARVRPAETELAKAAHQLGPRRRSNSRHQATS